MIMMYFSINENIIFPSSFVLVKAYGTVLTIPSVIKFATPLKIQTRTPPINPLM